MDIELVQKIEKSGIPYDMLALAYKARRIKPSRVIEAVELTGTHISHMCDIIDMIDKLDGWYHSNFIEDYYVVELSAYFFLSLLLSLLLFIGFTA